MQGRTRFMRLVSIAIGSAAVVLLGGCPNDATAPSLASVTGRYDAGQYELALQEGTAVASRGPAADRPQADLLAGMAAFQLDRFDEAERHFLAAERSSTPSIRGRARVMLANIRLEQGRTDDAAALFDSGAADLTGADADKARRYATLARDGQLGDGQSRTMPVVTAAAAPARTSPDTAKPASAGPVTTSTAAGTPARAPGPTVSSTPKPPAPPAQPTPTAPPAGASSRTSVQASAAASDGIFTVRAGAYTTEAAATRRIKALAADVRRAKAPQPHVAPVTTKDGDTLYAVRIGSFRSRAEAETLLKRLARKDLAVGAL